MKFQQIIFAFNRNIQVLISLEYTLFNIIPKSLVTLQFLKFLIVQIKAYIQGFQIRYQSFLGHWYPNSYSWFSDSIDIPFVLISTVDLQFDIKIHLCTSLTDRVLHYNTKTKVFTNWPSLNFKRRAHSCVLLNDKIIVAGGPG